MARLGGGGARPLQGASSHRSVRAPALWERIDFLMRVCHTPVKRVL